MLYAVAKEAEKFFLSKLVVSWLILFKKEMILNALLYFANKGSLKTFFSSCKSHNQCKTPEATELKKLSRNYAFCVCPNFTS